MKRVILISSSSAAGTVRRMFRKFARDRGTRVIGSYEDYSHGPLTTLGTSRNFILSRQAFWDSLHNEVGVSRLKVDMITQHASMVGEIKSAENTELWIDDSVQSMFFAAVALNLLALDEVDTSRMSVRYLVGDQAKWGVGAVTIAGFEELYALSEAQPINPELYDETWKAISEESGGPIKNLLNERNLPIPLMTALSAYLLRFPDFNGGLGSIERSLLGAGTEDMRKSAYTVGGAMAKGEPQNDHVGDMVLFKKLIELCRADSDRWFSLEGDPQHMSSCSVQLTESGKEARAKYSVQPL